MSPLLKQPDPYPIAEHRARRSNRIGAGFIVAAVVMFCFGWWRHRTEWAPALLGLAQATGAIVMAAVWFWAARKSRPLSPGSD
jgi:hypothetical protein